MGAWLVAAGVNGLIAVAAGAFAAHGLRASFDASALGWVETASRYQLWHALAFLGVALLPTHWLVPIAGWLFLTGIILFSGSLYVLALTGVRAVAVVTPIGGLALIAGWGALVLFGILRWRAGVGG
jgi:uncharacterized membrane protein YgdD (TMEM256/DUF423 family)